LIKRNRVLEYPRSADDIVSIPFVTGIAVANAMACKRELDERLDVSVTY